MGLDKLVKKALTTAVLIGATWLGSETINFPANIIHPSNEPTTGIFEVYDNYGEVIHSEETTIPANANSHLFQYQSTPNSNEDVEPVSANLSIYPNPSRGNINIKTDGKGPLEKSYTKKITIENNNSPININYDKNIFREIALYNLRGQDVTNENKLATGTYFVKMFTNQNYNKNQPIIKESKDPTYSGRFTTTSQNVLPQTYIFDSINNFPTVQPVEGQNNMVLENMIEIPNFTLIRADGTEYLEPVKIITENYQTGTTLEQDIVSGSNVYVFENGITGLVTNNDEIYSKILYKGTEEAKTNGTALSNARIEAIGDGLNLENKTYFILYDRHAEQADDNHMSIRAETNSGSNNATFAFGERINLFQHIDPLYNFDYTPQQLENARLTINNRIQYLCDLITTSTAEAPYINEQLIVENNNHPLFNLVLVDLGQQPIGTGIHFNDTGYSYDVGLVNSTQNIIQRTAIFFDISHLYDNNTDLTPQAMGELLASLSNMYFANNQHGQYSKFPQNNQFEGSDYTEGDKGISLETNMSKPGIDTDQIIAIVEYNGENDTYKFINTNKKYNTYPASDDLITTFDGDRQYTTLIQRSN